MLNASKVKSANGFVVDPKQTNDVKWVVAGVDAGSTQTRVCLVDKQEAGVLLSEDITSETLNLLTSQLYIIPSTFAMVDDEREIKSNSRALEDNYDSHVIRVQSAAVKPLVGNNRMVRGQKISDSSGLVPRYLDSSTNKMDNAIFYLNVLDGIGYGLLQKFSGNIPTEVHIHLALSVRPKELNKVCITRMNENIIGEFVFRWGGINIRMHIEDAIYTTEPEAQIAGTSSIMDVKAAVEGDEEALKLSSKLNESDSYMHIEGGGSSIGVEVVKQGNIIDACSSTFQLGGNYLTRIIIDRLRDVKGRTVSEESVRQALQTCLLRNGQNREDITEILAAAKNQVGMDIMERIRHEVIDVAANLTLNDMDFVTLGGRLFSEDDAGQSIGQYFAQYLGQISPHTDVIILKDNYIPQGNMIICVNEHEGFADTDGAASSVGSSTTYAGLGTSTSLADLVKSGTSEGDEDD